MTHGDVVLLRNGNEIQGEVLEEGSERVVVKFPGGVLELRKREVREIRRQPRVVYLVEQGEKQARRGDPQGAILTLEAALAEDPGSERARAALITAKHGLAVWLRDLKRHAEAREAFEALLRFEPSHPTAKEEIRALEELQAEAAREEERGRSELSSGDLESAVWRLHRVFDGFPERREALAKDLAAALVKQGNGRLNGGAWQEAEDLYAKALAMDPEVLPRVERPFTFARVRRIQEILPAGDFAIVEALAAGGLEVSPACGAFRYYRAVALEGQARTREAAEEYLSITGGKRPASLEGAVARLRQEAESIVARDGLAPTEDARWREVLPGDYRELLTRRFRIQHKNTHVADQVAASAEKAYDETFRLLGCSTHLRVPIQVQVHPDKESYLATSNMASWSGGAHLVSRRMGNLSEHRIYCFQGQPRLATGVIPHEVGHALLAHRLNYPPSIPLWAAEGFAISREPAHFHAYYRRLLAHAAASKMLLPVKDIIARSTYPEDRVELFYAQSFSLVEFLISLEDLETFLRFLKAVSEPGAEWEVVLPRFYDLPGKLAFSNRWLGWLEYSAKRE